MNLLLVLCAFVCTLEAAKYKYFVENLSSNHQYAGPLTDTVWILHDRNVDLFVAGGVPSKGLEGLVTSGDQTRFLTEVRTKKGVYGAGTLDELAPSDSTSFFIQGSDPVARFTIISRVGITASSFISNQGSRLPADIVTDFSQDFKVWNLVGGKVEEIQDDLDNDYPTGPQYIRVTGRRVCPDNDVTLYVKFDGINGLPLSAPLFWTQAGGSNALFWPNGDSYSALVDFVTTGNNDALFEQSIQNEDVCFSLASAVEVQTNGTQVWEVPIAIGHKLFFASSAGVAAGQPTVLLAPDNNGLSPWNGEKLHAALDVTDMIRVWDDGRTSRKVTIRNDVPARNYVHTFLFDHFPKGDEFVEEEETLLDGYEIGICGSYIKEKDGTFSMKEWDQHPYDCVDQAPGNQCMFCKGRANDKIVSLCLERLGAPCNTAFNTPAREAFCNLEFECPASTVSFSLFLIFSFTLALFYVA